MTKTVRKEIGWFPVGIAPSTTVIPPDSGEELVCRREEGTAGSEVIVLVKKDGMTWAKMPAFVSYWLAPLLDGRLVEVSASVLSVVPSEDETRTRVRVAVFRGHRFGQLLRNNGTDVSAILHSQLFSLWHHAGRYAPEAIMSYASAMREAVRHTGQDFVTLMLLFLLRGIAEDRREALRARADNVAAARLRPGDPMAVVQNQLEALKRQLSEITSSVAGHPPAESASAPAPAADAPAGADVPPALPDYETIVVSPDRLGHIDYGALTKRLNLYHDSGHSVFVTLSHPKDLGHPLPADTLIALHPAVRKMFVTTPVKTYELTPSPTKSRRPLSVVSHDTFHSQK